MSATTITTTTTAATTPTTVTAKHDYSYHCYFLRTTKMMNRAHTNGKDTPSPRDEKHQQRCRNGRSQHQFVDNRCKQTANMIAGLNKEMQQDVP